MVTILAMQGHNTICIAMQGHNTIRIAMQGSQNNTYCNAGVTIRIALQGSQYVLQCSGHNTIAIHIFLSLTINFPLTSFLGDKSNVIAPFTSRKRLGLDSWPMHCDG